MEEKRMKIRLNLFDGIVILIALLAAAVLLWNRFKPQEVGSTVTATTTNIQFTVRLQGVLPGTGELVREGDLLVDAIKNFEVGRVVSARTIPAQRNILDEESRCFVLADLPGYDDVELLLESNASFTEDKVLVGSGYEVRVGEKIYLRGPGYLGSGEVYQIERGA